MKTFISKQLLIRYYKENEEIYEFLRNKAWRKFLLVNLFCEVVFIS